MGEASAAAKQPSLGDQSAYVRFIVLGGARTGSSMLVQALNSSPHIRCFREIFNWQLDFIDFQMDGYDNFNEQDRALRKRDPVGFLRERIFCPHPEQIQAVGFKFLYPHFWGFPGLVVELAEDTELRVLNIRRRNLLRMLVSLKIAQRTNVWLEDQRQGLTLAKAIRATRHPLKAAARLQRRLRRRRASRDASRAKVTISAEELSNFIVRTNITTAHFDKLFQRHPTLTVFYEDMVDRREDVLRQAQSFVGVEPRPLAVTLRRQNPEPLPELIENYDELYEAYKDSPHASLFT